ncbi:MAG: DUF11 domain-containing protein [Clostridiales bacterium]|nr:DUF11 domain-containing protein [Clostridiales bacterium]
MKTTLTMRKGYWRKIIGLATALALVMSFAGSSQPVLASSDEVDVLFFGGNPGAIWTTDEEGQQQNGNIYGSCDGIYLNGHKFKPNEELEWEVTGTSGSPVYASGTLQADGNGKFSLVYLGTFSILQEYKVTVYRYDNKGKRQKVDSDNFKVAYDCDGLVLTKTVAPSVIAYGDGTGTVTYTITLTNNTGKKLVKGYKVEDPLLDWSFTGSKNLGNGKSESWTVTRSVADLVQQAGKCTIENTARASGDIDLGGFIFKKYRRVSTTGSATLTVQEHPAVQITKTADPSEPLQLGDVVTYTITVTNNGDVPLHDVVVSDEALGKNWTVGILNPGDTWSDTVTRTVTAEDLAKDSLDNEAKVTAKSPCGTQLEEDSRRSIPTARAQLAITKEASDLNPRQGDEVTYTITVTNEGPAELANTG